MQPLINWVFCLEISVSQYAEQKIEFKTISSLTTKLHNTKLIKIGSRAVIEIDGTPAKRPTAKRPSAKRPDLKGHLQKGQTAKRPSAKRPDCKKDRLKKGHLQKGQTAKRPYITKGQMIPEFLWDLFSFFTISAELYLWIGWTDFGF